MAISGIGIGAFMDGAMKGANFMQAFNQQKQKGELVDMQIQDLKDERAQKQAVRDISQQGVQDAQANTDGGIQNVMNYYMQNTVPKIQQQYLARGDVKTADAFGKWVQDENVQQGMRYGANMIRAAHQNDPQGVMDNMVKLYNQPGYFEDGKSAVSAKFTTGDDGKPTGMQIILKDNKTGKEETHTFNSMKDVYDTAMQFGQPDQVFKYGMEQVAAGQKTEAEIAKENRDWQRTVKGKQLDQDFRLEAQNNQSQLRQAEESAKLRNPAANKKVQDAKATIAFLRENGADDAFIRKNLPSIIGIENRSRPEASRIDDYIKMKSANDTKFNRKPLDEQIAEARNYISQVDATASDDGDDGESLGLPDAKPAQPDEQGDGVYFLDTKTGKIISR